MLIRAERFQHHFHSALYSDNEHVVVNLKEFAQAGMMTRNCHEMYRVADVETKCFAEQNSGNIQILGSDYEVACCIRESAVIRYINNFVHSYFACVVN